MSNDDPRYPYTYACDFIRSLAGFTAGGTKLSRADASQIRSGIAKAIGMNDEELARKLADYYQKHENELSERTVQQYIAAQGIA